MGDGYYRVGVEWGGGGVRDGHEVHGVWFVASGERLVIFSLPVMVAVGV